MIDESQCPMPHRTIAHRTGTAGAALDLPVGAQLRILSNHACAAAAQHARYHVLDNTPVVAEVWERIGGW